jgi:hypothetical protein
VAPAPHFLVPALDGALSLAEVHHLAPAVAKDLHLDVVRLLDELLHKHLRVGAARRVACVRACVCKSALCMDTQRYVGAREPMEQTRTACPRAP